MIPAMGSRHTQFFDILGRSPDAPDSRGGVSRAFVVLMSSIPGTLVSMPSGRGDWEVNSTDKLEMFRLAQIQFQVSYLTQDILPDHRIRDLSTMQDWNIVKILQQAGLCAVVCKEVQQP